MMTRKRILARQNQPSSCDSNEIDGVDRNTTGHNNNTTGILGVLPLPSQLDTGVRKPTPFYRLLHPSYCIQCTNTDNDMTKIRLIRTRCRSFASSKRSQKITLMELIGLLFLVVIVVLCLPRWIFNLGRSMLMSRPAFLYGTPIEWSVVSGCLSRTHRREVRAYFHQSENKNKDGVSMPSGQVFIPTINSNVKWNWNLYSRNHSELHTNTKRRPLQRLLIAQYSGTGSYERLLREVEPINRAYARKWGHDYTTMIGTGLKFPGLLYNDSGTFSESDSHHCRYYSKNQTESSSSYNYEAQSTFNKIPLLLKALDESPQHYDQVLILDADTMIVDFDYDITSMLQHSTINFSKNELANILKNNDNRKIKGSLGSNSAQNHHANVDQDNALFSPYFLVAYRCYDFDWTSTWDVNAGITLWNLKHPLTRHVAEEWLRSSLSDPKQILLKSDDQYYLQRTLQKLSKTSEFQTLQRYQKKFEKKNTIRTTIQQNFWTWCTKNSFLPSFLDYFKRHFPTGIERWWPFGNDQIELQGEFSRNCNSSGSHQGCNGFMDIGVGIRAVRDEFDYYDGTVVKHFKRDLKSWSRTGLEQRLLRIQEVKAEVCKIWPIDCQE